MGAASVASAGTDTTTPEDTAAAGTEPAGTEASRHRGTAGTEPAGGGAGAGAGSGADSGIEGADLAGTEVSILSVETSGSPGGRRDGHRTQ